MGNDGEPFGKRTSEVACYYATGNTKDAPRTMSSALKKYYNEETHGEWDKYRADFKALLVEMADYWNVVKFQVAEALRYEAA